MKLNESSFKSNETMCPSQDAFVKKRACANSIATLGLANNVQLLYRNIITSTGGSKKHANSVIFV